MARADTRLGPSTVNDGLMTPTGRFTQNTTDQCTFSTRKALIAGPTTAAKPHTAELAATYAAAPTKAIAMTKRLFERSQTGTLEEQLELEAQLQTAATESEDFTEGVNAFREKRPPSFTDRVSDGLPDVMPWGEEPAFS